MLVRWNKEFYEKYKDVFSITVYGKISISNFLGNYETIKTENYTLDMSEYTEKNGILTVRSVAHKMNPFFSVADVYMEVPDEIVDIFEDLEPAAAYNLSWTVTVNK